MESKDKNKHEVVRHILTEFLSLHKLRATRERFEILDAIYNINGHFTNDQLQDYLENVCKFRVSRATVYNTLNLFMDARLVVCHNCSVPPQYERALFVDPHFHLICTECKSMTEMKNSLIGESLKLVDTKRFKAAYHMLYVYGLCAKCALRKKRELKKLDKL